MEYTVEEKILITDKAKEIETWIKNNIVPQIVNNNVLSVDYGNYYEINVSKNNVKIHRLGFSSQDDICLSRPKNQYEYTAVATLIFNWSKTKIRLLIKLDSSKKLKESFVESLKNFKI